MPLFNSSKTFQQTLNSISSQSFKDIELVFVDGGSADDTQLIVNNFRKYGQTAVQFISEPDKGIYDAMNKGLEMATGQWFYFIGGDDTLAGSDTLQTMYNAIQSQNADLVYGNVTGAVSGTKYTDNTLNKVLSRGIHHQGIFYKRNVFEYTGKYALTFKVAADYHLTLKVFCNPAFKTRYIDVDIARFGEAGLSSTMYDYRFFSYHYHLLAQHNAADKLDDKAACLNQSVYCCLYLAKTKQSMSFAWSNILYYIIRPNPLSISQRFKTFFNMLIWTAKPAR
ncbi:glycosyltransferase family 2 protein [Mucilaginibacter glaciei]|uniref:Glycosyltransferase n=1 Tax=Mucilaginibacter glaciei TaxID=2772109 RepID=A0A926NVB9_9SPHI|nr:glycosyltransferase family 2 protein [Mucilaginibacter glaciei]MBD1394710.1 glycosyltransferase [Mucilaginibacter glaciei]